MSLELARIAVSALVLIGCRPAADTASPGATTQAEENAESDNLCVQYETCDSCVAGQMDTGRTQGTAQSECAMAAAGCWVTWEKPITCSGDTVDVE